MEHHDMYKTSRSFTHSKGKFSPVSGRLIRESPLEIIINRERRILIMFTPHMARELVVGFLFTDGLIRGLSDLLECTISDKGEGVTEAAVKIPSHRLKPSTSKDARISYSSCGVCGKEDYRDLNKGLSRVKSTLRFSMEVLKGLPAGMQRFQPLYEKTGGAHAAILFDAKGRPVLHSEDMGRHNALDKVIGASLIRDIPMDDKVLVSSGRASLEMILKAVRAGIPLFVAMSRPTSRAVEAAKFYNVTLMDMARDTNRIYSHVRRIEGF
jgi:FdhD protein